MNKEKWKQLSIREKLDYAHYNEEISWGCKVYGRYNFDLEDSGITFDFIDSEEVQEITGEVFFPKSTLEIKPGWRTIRL